MRDREGEEGLLADSNRSSILLEKEERLAVPSDGCLFWMTPDGILREVSPGELGHTAETGPMDTACTKCGGTSSIRTIAREHQSCGHVGLDGFVDTAANGKRSCPKCGDVGADFAIVAEIHSCLSCGQITDQPLGGVRDSDD